MNGQGSDSNVLPIKLKTPVYGHLVVGKSVYDLIFPDTKRISNFLSGNLSVFNLKLIRMICSG